MNEPKGPQTNWSVAEVEYPGTTTVTEFNFSNGVTIHYDVQGGKGDLTMFLPAKEVVESRTPGTLAFKADGQFTFSMQMADNDTPTVVNVIAEVK